jgi:hypothetical protein
VSFSGEEITSSAGPFSEIDSAATLTAEGEIGAAALDRLLADRALQLEMIGHVVASSTRNDLTIGSQCSSMFAAGAILFWGGAKDMLRTAKAPKQRRGKDAKKIDGANSLLLTIFAK